MPTRDEDLRLALELTDRAGKLALDYFEHGFESRLKEDGSPVTEADHAVERRVRSLLEERRSDDGVLGEEFGERGTGPRTWILDPIDGTSQFIEQTVHWRIHLALRERDTITTAAVVAPAQRRQWWATLDGGAFESEWPRTPSTEARRLSVSSTESRDQATIQTYPPNRFDRKLEEWDVQMVRSPVPLAICRGNLDGFVFEGCRAWDHAPWVLLVQESGGAFTDWTGGQSPFEQGGLFSNARLHPKLIEILL